MSILKYFLIVVLSISAIAPLIIFDYNRPYEVVRFNMICIIFHSFSMGLLLLCNIINKSELKYIVKFHSHVCTIICFLTAIFLFNITCDKSSYMKCYELRVMNLFLPMIYIHILVYFILISIPVGMFKLSYYYIESYVEKRVNLKKIE
jgi:hypothetical protein